MVSLLAVFAVVLTLDFLLLRYRLLHVMQIPCEPLKNRKRKQSALLILMSNSIIIGSYENHGEEKYRLV